MKTIILIFEELRYGHHSPFSIYDIEPFFLNTCWDQTQAPCFHGRSYYLSATVLISNEQWDVKYWIEVYSVIQYNVRFRSLQSDIGGSESSTL
jgi:hypothetical protein